MVFGEKLYFSRAPENCCLTLFLQSQNRNRLKLSSKELIFLAFRETTNLQVVKVRVLPLTKTKSDYVFKLRLLVTLQSLEVHGLVVPNLEAPISFYLEVGEGFSSTLKVCQVLLKNTFSLLKQAF